MRLAAVLFAIALSASSLGGQQPPKPPADQLPPLSYVCPMAGDEEVIEDKPGVCRKCGMELKPTRLDSVWTCATRPLLVVESIIGRDLSLALKEKIVQVGFVFLIRLMGFVLFNDLSKIFSFDRLFR